MKIENGMIVLGTRLCSFCEGTKGQVERIRCPLYDKAMRGKACPHCGATRKDGHRYLETGKMVPCGFCNGSGVKQEDMCDTADSIYHAMTFKVYRQDREATWNELHLGAGCVYACADYGRAWNSPEEDEKLIEVARNHTFIQACKIARNNGQLANHIGIFVNCGGYSVRPVFTMEETAARIAGEPGETAARIIGGAIAAQGGNGTAYAAGGLT